MQINSFARLRGASLRVLSHFTTKRTSKKRKTGIVERLFSKISRRARRVIRRMQRNMGITALLFTVTLLLTISFCIPSDRVVVTLASEDAREAATKSEALLPSERPEGSFSDAECISVFYVTGDTGENVLALERALMTLGYDVGNADGIYSSQTAAALRRFQSDRGLQADGICTEALCHTAVSLAGSGHVREKTVSQGILADALYRAGCLSEENARASVQNRQILRDALILFQRSRGLRGEGESNYATLCALGLGGVFVYEEDSADDLQIYLIASYLARFSACYPEEAELHTLICVASSLYNRAVLLGAGEPLFSVVCSAPIVGETETIGNAKAPNALCLRAAEDALLRLSNGTDPVRGATEYCHASYYEAYAKNVEADTEKAPEMVRRVGKLYFFK